MVGQLRAAGAHILVAEGSRGRGRLAKFSCSCHIKCCVINSRIAYCGSANYTEAALKNFELVFRLTGPPVVQVCGALARLLDSENCVPM